MPYKIEQFPSFLWKGSMEGMKETTLPTSTLNNQRFLFVETLTMTPNFFFYDLNLQ